jgi:CheY-like chemotaxis protein
MAPEAITGKGEPGLAHLIDLYSIGVIAFEMLSGSLPYDSLDVTEILCQHLDSPVPDLASMRPGIPAPLTALVRRLMAKDPRERPPRADEVLWQLMKLRRRAPELRHGMSVLIVDDDLDSRRVLKACVERSLPNAEVRVAAGASEALRHVRREGPDVLLLDLRMPGMNGLELYLALSGMRALDRAEVVIVSGEARARDLEILRSVGATKFLIKGPGLPHQLAALLRAVAMQRSAQRVG